MNMNDQTKDDPWAGWFEPVKEAEPEPVKEELSSGHRKALFIFDSIVVGWILFWIFGK
jgi:hypothetical protein